MRFGYRRLTAMLVREGMTANHKRVYRLYREEGLAMRFGNDGGSAGAAWQPTRQRPGGINAGRWIS